MKFARPTSSTETDEFHRPLSPYVRMKMGLTDKGRQVPARVLDFIIRTMVATHKRFVNDNFWIYRTRCMHLYLRYYTSTLNTVYSAEGMSLAKLNVIDKMIDMIWPFRKQPKGYWRKLQQLREMRIECSTEIGTIEDAYFQLLPHSEMRRAFIDLDHQLVCTLYNNVMGLRKVPNGMGMNKMGVSTFERIFGFFQENTYRCPRSTQHKDSRYGVPQLYKSRWAFAPNLEEAVELYEGETPIRELPFPTLVSLVSTDGIQAKLHTITCAPMRDIDDISLFEEEGGEESVEEEVPAVEEEDEIVPDLDVVDEEDDDLVDFNAENINNPDIATPSQPPRIQSPPARRPVAHVRSIGVDDIREKAYSFVTEEIDPSCFNRGIFGNTAEKSNLPKCARIIAVDPGRVEVAAYVSCEVKDGDNIDHFVNLDGSSTGSYSSKDYRHNSKFESFLKWEKTRRIVTAEDGTKLETPYGRWVRKSSKLTLKKPGKAKTYVDAAYESLEIRITELLTTVRAKKRFRMFSARQRALRDIAKHIVYAEVMPSRVPGATALRTEAERVRKKYDKKIYRVKKKDEVVPRNPLFVRLQSWLQYLSPGNGEHQSCTTNVAIESKR